MTVKTVLARTTDELLVHQEAWQDLAANAVEPNVFYEPCPLIAALRHLGGTDDFLALFVYADDTLIGLFPHRVRSRLVGRRLLELYRHRHSFLQTPLLRREKAGEAVGAWLDWCGGEIGAAVIMCTGISGSSPLTELIENYLDSRGGVRSYRNSYGRPLQTVSGDGEAHVAKALSGNRRRRLTKHRRRLEDQGKVEVRLLTAADDVDAWINNFVALEQSGWKGENRSAIGSDPRSRAFFEELIRELHGRGQILMLGLVLDGRWIAMNCVLRAAGDHSGTFGFKSAYDERFRDFSPSNLLYVELAKLVNEKDQAVAWLDSCARAQNPFLERLLGDEREITTLSIGLPGIKGRLGLSALHWALKAKSAWGGEEASDDAGKIRDAG